MCFASVPCTLWTCSCHAYLHKHVFLLLVALPCHVLLCGEWFKLTNMPTYCCSCHVWICNITCHVYMGAIIFSVPFWLMVSKGLLIYAISRFMPCLCLPWYVPVTCCLIALNIATWCYFLISLKLLLFAILPCVFEHVLVISGDSSVFMFCHALPVLHAHAFCCYVELL